MCLNEIVLVSNIILGGAALYADHLRPEAERDPNRNAALKCGVVTDQRHDLSPSAAMSVARSGLGRDGSSFTVISLGSCEQNVQDEQIFGLSGVT